MTADVFLEGLAPGAMQLHENLKLHENIPIFILKKKFLAHPSVCREKPGKCDPGMS